MILRNKKLEGINPHDPSLTIEEKVAILKECQINPLYFIECVVGRTLTKPQKKLLIYCMKDNLMLTDEEDVTI